jgi:glycerol-3-phosphate acyltransferase PlsY
VLTLFVILSGYFLGAIPFGFLVAKAKGIDIRKQGSGNIGATNVGRVLGLRWFFVVFSLDFAKAAVPVFLIAKGFWPAVLPESWPASAVAALMGLAILLGNMFPIYLQFRGGKGAAVGTGIMLPLAFYPGLAALAAFLIVFLPTRYVSLGSITAAIVMLATQFFLLGVAAFAGENGPVTWLMLVGTALVVFRHRSNIGRLLQGTESKIAKQRVIASPSESSPSPPG